LPSAYGVAPGKGWRQVAAFTPVDFAGGHIWPSGGSRRRINFADGWTLSGAWHRAKAALPGVSFCWKLLCRVSDKKLTTNYFILGKSAVSRSVSSIMLVLFGETHWFGLLSLLPCTEDKSGLLVYEYQTESRAILMDGHLFFG
jgi:hypothetical protein